VSPRSATAIAHPNIAFAKYWGKRSIEGNVPATPSVSVTLGGLETKTTVTFDEALEKDALSLNDAPNEGEPLVRVVKLLDEVRALAGIRARARVVTSNSFPTASGLASSASGFAALARAASAAAGLDLDDRAASRLARRASASAARSIFGGFVALGIDDDPAAEPIAGASHWAIAVVVAAVTAQPKLVGSTRGMEHTRKTSPFYESWVTDAPIVAREVRAAILARDLERLGTEAEASALRMHACAMAANPPIVYWSGATLELLSAVRALRHEGIGAWATMDAGPHVKVIVKSDDAPMVAERLRPLTVRTIVAHVGEGARLVPSGDGS
jgi:diphosphomevalonate decarboxylase